MMDETLLDRFQRLIVDHTGIRLRTGERQALRDAVAARMTALRLRHADEYYHVLRAGSHLAESEWEPLISYLTNNESYFFRDKGQMALLRERILPELIARNEEQRSLRLWSAGCSTGEEAYSLAMLVDDLLPQRRSSSDPRWKIVILGTDIDAAALRHARRGLYGSWSFRTMEPALQQRCFERREGGWQVAEAARSLVTFGRCNLVSDSFPSAVQDTRDMDLILCRNVFIYFAPEAVSAVLPKFARTLREGGYLMTGHTEIRGQPVEPLQSCMFPESVVYRRVGKVSDGAGNGAVARQPFQTAGSTASTLRRQHPPAHSHEPAVEQPVSTTIPTPHAAPPKAVLQPLPAERTLAAVEDCYAASDFLAVIRALQLQREPAGVRELMLLAHAHANLGHYDEATAWCHRLIKERPFASDSYELLAAIAQEERRSDDAKLLLKKALYLSPASPGAYLELGAIYRGEGDGARARTMDITALELLKQMPPESVVGSMGGPCARDWILHLSQLLAEGD